jgi:hypothetical protein
MVWLRPQRFYLLAEEVPDHLISSISKEPYEAVMRPEEAAIDMRGVQKTMCSLPGHGERMTL